MTVHLYETGQADPGESLPTIAAATGLPLSWFAEEAEASKPMDSEPTAPAEPSEQAASEVEEPGRASEPEEMPAQVEQPTDELDERTAALAVQADELAEREVALAKREAELDERAIELEQRTAELNERAAALEAERSSVQALAATLTAREAALAEHASAEPDPPPTAAPAPAATAAPVGGDAGPVHSHDVSGKSMIVDTADGGHVRVTVALRDDPEEHVYESEYEVMTADLWQGKPIFVWQRVDTYRSSEAPTVEECFDAALREIAAGPRPPEPREKPEPAPDPEPPPQAVAPKRKPKRGLLGFLRR